MKDMNKPYIVKNMFSNKTEKDDIIETGYLSVNVVNRANKEPIPNAIVSLFRITISGTYSEQGEGTLVTMAITDQNGNIPKMELVANNQFSRGLGEQTQYAMSVQADNYYSVLVVDIQIYPDITTTYSINLSRISSKIPRYEFILNPVIQK